MNFKELMLACRSYRRFNQNHMITQAELRDIIDHVRLMPSPANLQPLKFILINRRETCQAIFPHLKWAAYLENWEGPEEGERPAAYIVMLGNRKMSLHINWDYGIALQILMLSNTEKGYGGCAIAACNKKKIAEILEIPADYEIGCVVALGQPRETVVIDKVKHGNIKYWRDGQDIHHVPKRSIDELILKVIE